MLHPRTWLSLLVVSCGIVMVSAAAFTLSVDNSSFRSLKASSETMENFSVRLVVSTGRHNRTHHPSSRHDVVVGPIPGRDIPRSSILSFVVCHSHHLQHYADPSLVGTSVQNLAFARHSSSLQHRYQVLSVLCLLSVKFAPSRKFPLT